MAGFGLFREDLLGDWTEMETVLEFLMGVVVGLGDRFVDSEIAWCNMLYNISGSSMDQTGEQGCASYCIWRFFL